jgi:RecA/RadA recombinase
MSSILAQMMKEKTYADIKIESIANQKPSEHFSTGSLALNGILSGNVFTGIPEDTIVALCGESNTGKSYILAHIVKSAIDKGYDVLIFDSERAVRKDYYERIGCDINKIFRIPVGSTLDFRNKAFKIIQDYYSRTGPEGKLFVGLDSLANLASEKELADAEAEKTVADQGNNAKGQNSAFRVISSLASEYNFPCVFTNHVYASIGEFIATRPKISGGGKAIYNSHIILFCERLVNKEEVEDAFGAMKKTQIGIKMKITTIKNREYPEEKSVNIALRYDEGLNPYSGLLDFAIRSGVIENKPKGYLVTATGKTVYDKDLYTAEVFSPEALAKINEWLGKNGYSSLSDIMNSDVASAVKEIGATNEEEDEEGRNGSKGSKARSKKV